jgi:hypothetical protein
MEPEPFLSFFACVSFPDPEFWEQVLFIVLPLLSPHKCLTYGKHLVEHLRNSFTHYWIKVLVVTKCYRA